MCVCVLELQQQFQLQQEALQAVQLKTTVNTVWPTSQCEFNSVQCSSSKWKAHLPGESC